MSGEAFKLRLAIANLQKQHGLVSPPFTPLPLGPVVTHDIVREGYASPATIDREHTLFAANCWTPFKPDIPILYRHQADQPAGKLEDISVDDKGLFARVRLSHALAKQCPYFSVCATIHSWKIVQAGARSYGLITSASLDEVSLVPDAPGNAQALVQRPPPGTEFYDLCRLAFEKAAQITEVMQRVCAQPKIVKSDRPLSYGRPTTPHIYGKIPQRPPRARSEFSRLAAALNEREA